MFCFFSCLQPGDLAPLSVHAVNMLPLPFDGNVDETSQSQLTLVSRQPEQPTNFLPSIFAARKKAEATKEAERESPDTGETKRKRGRFYGKQDDDEKKGASDKKSKDEEKSKTLDIKRQKYEMLALGLCGMYTENTEVCHVCLFGTKRRSGTPNWSIAVESTRTDWSGSCVVLVNIHIFCTCSFQKNTWRKKEKRRCLKKRQKKWK